MTKHSRKFDIAPGFDSYAPGLRDFATVLVFTAMMLATLAGLALLGLQMVRAW